MKNYITEPIPYDWFEIDAIEGWLDEHVRQGLRLHSITRSYRARFVPSTESFTRYRIHIKPTDSDISDTEYRESLRELGWEYIDSFDLRTDVYQAIRPDAVEINTDEDVLKDTINEMCKTERTSLIVIILVFSLLLFLEFSIFLGCNCIYDFLLYNGVTVLGHLFMFLSYPILLVSNIRRHRDIKQRFLLQREYHTPAKVKKRKNSLLYSYVFSAVIVIAGIVMVIFLEMSDKEGAARTCPVVDLSVVNAVESSSLEKPGIFAAHKDSILYYYDSYRSYAEPIMMPGDWVYSPYSYEVYVYEIRIESWAAPYLQECLSASDELWQQVTIDGWDEAWYQSYMTTHLERLGDLEGIEALPPYRQQNLYLRNGNTVISINYNGATDLYPRLQELYGK